MQAAVKRVEILSETQAPVLKVLEAPPVRVLERGGDDGTKVVPLINPNKALWEKGDFTKIAALMRESGEAVVKSLGIAPPVRRMSLCAAARPGASRRI